MPFELVDAVLVETGSAQRQLRDLPSRVGVYFVLVPGLFPRQGYGKVWDKLVASLGGLLLLPCPSGKALHNLRRRLGAAPLQALFEALSGPVAQPGTPGVRFGRYRTVAFDGCVSPAVPLPQEGPPPARTRHPNHRNSRRHPRRQHTPTSDTARPVLDNRPGPSLPGIGPKPHKMLRPKMLQPRTFNH
jgi:hypothetical protein